MNFPPRWNNLPDGHLVTRAEVEMATGISPSTLCNHSYAGLLPFIPGRPVHIRVGDLRLYFKMMANGISKKLHRSLRVEHEDRQAYSVLHGVAEFTNKPPDIMIGTVVKQTEALWRKYKDQNAHKRKMEQKRRGKASPSHKAK